MRCDLCDELATIHVTEHVGDKTFQRSLCAKHGAEDMPGGPTTMNAMRLAKLRSLVVFIRQYNRWPNQSEAEKVSMEAYGALTGVEHGSPDEAERLEAALEYFEQTGRFLDTDSSSETS